MKKIFTILTIIILFIQCEEQKKQENSSIEESDFKVVGYVRSMQDNWGPNMEKAKQPCL